MLYGCNNTNAPQNLSPLIDSISFEEVGDTIACRRGIEDAVKDYQAGELGLYFYGLPNPEFNTRVRLMIEEYGLKLKGGGDIVEPAGKCYNKVMYELIEQKYGKNAFERIDTKVDSLYKLGLGDRDVKFKGGDEGLMKYIYCSLADSLLKEDSEAPLVVISLVIDEQGEIEESEILVRRNIWKDEALYDEKVEQLVEKMPRWIPAFQNKAAIKQRYTVPIKFSRKSKKNNCG
ncbi:hypothetical protein GCM10023188_00900 [Pontibacter saemangeumensis]|uniref:TonB protein C-terminal n=2 Tax=Pontibacter saemangeumensis TaxID=1084525 RepID=A0ABP8L549_9BACT